jgi:arginyl-tRNA synthetase
MPELAVRDQIASLIEQAIQHAQQQGVLPATSLPIGPIERPSNPAHGDYASTIALKLARSARMNPQQIARVLVDALPSSAMIGNVSIAGPGFINFTLSDAWLAEQVNHIVEAGPTFGNIDLGKGASVQVEFVSANPTGPLPAASGRGGSLGDSLARVLTAAGYSVQREYYVNDHGNQVKVFGESLLARYRQAFGLESSVPAHGYQGEYLVELGQHLKEIDGDKYLSLPDDEAARRLAEVGVDYFLTGIRSDLERLGITYDCWFSESSLFASGEVVRALDLLHARGHVASREGATWFVSSALGEDKDNVLVRSNGEPTYFASDIAYHRNKLDQRSFDRVIDVWGADHQGHVSRTRTGVASLGINPDRLQIVIHQLITLKVGGQPVRMSKRTGNIVLLREVIDEVGRDACRFFFVSRSADSHLDFDLDLAKRESDENPVYYVQYAHARISSILERAGERGLLGHDGDLTLIRNPAELALIRKMLELPELVALAASGLEPHHLPHYALDLASVFHSFYKQCRVISDDLDLTYARLKLVTAARFALRNTLELIGVTAPERMWQLTGVDEGA